MLENLDFNQYRPLVLPVTLRDEAATRLSVKLPTVELQEELYSYRDDFLKLIRQNDDETVDALYDLAARLLSCNRNLKLITAEQLRTKYNMEEEDIAIFFDHYTSFLQGVETAKN